MIVILIIPKVFIVFKQNFFLKQENLHKKAERINRITRLSILHDIDITINSHYLLFPKRRVLTLGNRRGAKLSFVLGRGSRGVLFDRISSL